MSVLGSFDNDEIILHSLVFALKPSEEAVAELAEIRGGIGVAEGHVLDHRLHIALWALDLPMTPTPETIDRLCKAAATLRGPALRLAFQEVVSKGKLTCLTPGDPMPVLKAFQHKLALAIADAQIWPNRGFRFEPHLTLAHGQQESVRRPIRRPVSWRSHEFVLIHSLVGLTEHVELGSWPLLG